MIVSLPFPATLDSVSGLLTVRKGMLSFFSPKGWELPAWGNAPGEARRVVPIRAWGVAPCRELPALWAEESGDSDGIRNLPVIHIPNDSQEAFAVEFRNDADGADEAIAAKKRKRADDFAEPALPGWTLDVAALFVN